MSESSRTRVGRNATAGATVAFINIFIGFLTTPMLLNQLGAETFGIFAVLTSLQAYFGTLDLGIGSSITRQMIADSARGDGRSAGAALSFGLMFYVMLGTLLLPVVIGLAPLIISWLHVPQSLRVEAEIALFVSFALFVCGAAGGIFSARLVAAQRMDLSAWSGLTGNLAFLAAVFIWLPHHSGLLGAMNCLVIQFFASSVATLLVLKATVRDRLIGDPRKIGRSGSLKMLRFGFWTQVNSVTALINLEADKLIIARFIGPAQVTSYQVGNRYAGLTRTFPIQFLLALFPDLTARIAAGETDVGALYARSLRSLMFITLVIAGFLVAVTQPFMLVWLGRPPPYSVPIAMALIVSFAVNNMTGVGTSLVRAQARPEIETVYAVTAATLNIVITLILTPRLGLGGVVAGTIAGNVIGSIGFVVLFHALTRISFVSSTARWLAPLLLATAIASTATFVMGGVIVRELGRGGWSDLKRVELALAVTVLGAAYLVVQAVLLSAFRFWTPDDADRLRALAESVRSRLGRTPTREVGHKLRT